VLKTAKRWGLASLILLALLVVADLAVLTFPQPFLPHRQQFGMLTIASDHPLPEDLERIVEEVRARGEAMEYPPANLPYRVFVCADEGLYRVFSLLLGRPAYHTQAIVFSLPGNIFLNATHIRRLGESNRRGLHHWRFQGDLADAIAHEVAHLSFGKELGSLNAARLPAWKAEGYADYQAHRGPILADPAYSLSERIGRLLDDDLWNGARLERRHFRWQLMAEYMATVKCLGLRGIADEAITESAVYFEMLEWYRLAETGESL